MKPRWAIRLVLAGCAVVLSALALATRAAPAPVADVAPPPALVTAAITPTAEPFEQRVVSRVARQTPAPYPTSTPLPTDVSLVSIVDFGYMPSVTRIHVGQTVLWQNGGRELHDVTGDDDWHSGPIEPPAEYRHTFGFEGTFTYRCTVHPDMRGTIIVER